MFIYLSSSNLWWKLEKSSLTCAYKFTSSKFSIERYSHVQDLSSKTLETSNVIRHANSTGIHAFGNQQVQLVRGKSQYKHHLWGAALKFLGQGWVSSNLLLKMFGHGMASNSRGISMKRCISLIPTYHVGHLEGKDRRALKKAVFFPMELENCGSKP